MHALVKYAREEDVFFQVLTVKPQYYPSVYQAASREEAPLPEGHIHRTKALEPPREGFRDVVYTVKQTGGLKQLVLKIARTVYRHAIVPDQFITWLPYGLRGVKEIKKSGRRFDFILSSGPPFTAHLIALAAHRRFKAPLLLDYRDLWNGSRYYARPFPASFVNKNLEKKVLSSARFIAVTTSRAKQRLLQEFPFIDPSLVQVVPNGFDFDPLPFQSPSQGPFTFLHLGSLTPERNPATFLSAIKKLIEEGFLKKDVKIIFQGYVHEVCRDSIESSGLGRMVEIRPDEPYNLAVRRLQEAHVLIVLQSLANGGDTAIPGKFYDYLAARRPVLVLDEEGATSEAARELGIQSVAHIFNEREILEKVKDIILRYEKHLETANRSTDALMRFHRREIFRSFFNQLKSTL